MHYCIHTCTAYHMGVCACIPEHNKYACALDQLCTAPILVQPTISCCSINSALVYWGYMDITNECMCCNRLYGLCRCFSKPGAVPPFSSFSADCPSSTSATKSKLASYSYVPWLVCLGQSCPVLYWGQALVAIGDVISGSHRVVQDCHREWCNPFLWRNVNWRKY